MGGAWYGPPSFSPLARMILGYVVDGHGLHRLDALTCANHYESFTLSRQDISPEGGNAVGHNSREPHAAACLS